jgi:hypothetical protein
MKDPVQAWRIRSYCKTLRAGSSFTKALCASFKNFGDPRGRSEVEGFRIVRNR